MQERSRLRGSSAIPQRRLFQTLGLSAALACLLPALAPAASVTFIGADTTDPNSLTRAANYSTGALPASGDTILFNGTPGINSTLTYSGPGGIAFYGSPGGVGYNVAAGQSGSLTIRGTGTVLFLLSTQALNVAAGAGPVTFNVSDNFGPLQFGLPSSTNATYTFSNNSANPVTFDNAVFYSGNGQQTAGSQTVQFTGTGDFALNTTFSTGAALNVAGTGLVTLSRASGLPAAGTTIGVAGSTSTSVLRVAASQTVATGTGAVTVGQGGTSTSRLELTGGSTLNNLVYLAGRTNGSVAVRNVSGNNTLSGTLALSGGSGTSANVQSDSGSLALTGPLSTSYLGATLVLQGAGNGSASGLISGPLSVSKAGTGTWTFSGANNSFTGGTTVSGGVLEISANGALGTGNVNVLSTGTSLTIDIGVTAPLNGNRGVLTLAGGGVAGVADAGYVDLSSGANITVYGLVLGTTTEPVGVYSAALYPDYIRGLGTITVAAIPEPGTWALLIIGLGGLFVHARAVRTRRAS